MTESLFEYGYCPVCEAPGIARDRTPGGNDKCAGGHTYPSADAVPLQTFHRVPVCTAVGPGEISIGLEHEVRFKVEGPYVRVEAKGVLVCHLDGGDIKHLIRSLETIS